MGDDDQRHPQLLLQILDQVQHLRLDRHVDRRGGLVGDQQPRPARQCHRDHGALAHAAGEIERVGVDGLSRLRHAHPVQHLDRLGARLPLGDLLVQHDHLHDLVADGVHGRKRGHGLLKHHRDLGAADLADGAALRIQRHQVDTALDLVSRTGCGRPRSRRSWARCAGSTAWLRSCRTRSPRRCPGSRPARGRSSGRPTALTVPCREKKWVCSPRTLSSAASGSEVRSDIRPWRRGRRRRAGRHPGS